MSTFDEKYQSIIATLNAEQLRAVQHIEGPMLVVAGPGTGKTHILAARIGSILTQTDTGAQSILCLTYSDAGVQAMRNRLLEMMGPDAFKVPIYTFHSFCNRLIKEHPEIFGRAKNLELISDLERIEKIEVLVKGLPSNHVVFKVHKNIHTLYTKLLSLFAKMKKERWTPEAIESNAQAWLDSLPTLDAFRYKINTTTAKKGDPKAAEIKAETERMTQLVAAARLYPKWINLLEDAGLYEYDDMILWMLDAFSKNEPFKRIVQERYLYVLVDEYQDTNSAQNQLIYHLIDYWDTPNIFIVGDDDQSIFEFQGARLHNLKDFYEKYSESLEVVVLKENYRSTQAILDAAHRLIEHNKLRVMNMLSIDSVELTKQLLAQGGVVGLVPEIYALAQQEHETAFVLQAIQEKLAAGIPASEIAVLYVKHAQCNQLRQALQKIGIPYHTKREENLLEQRLSVYIFHLLDYLQAELMAPLSSDHLLFRLLHAPYFGISTIDMAVIGMHLRSRKEEGKPIALRQLIGNAPLLQTLQLVSAEALLKASNALEALIAEAAQVSVLRYWEKMLGSTGMMLWILQHPDCQWHLQVLHTLSAWLAEEQNKFKTLRLEYLLELKDRLQSNHLQLNVRQYLDSERGIQLRTVHAAKGLEFDTVFIIGANQQAWYGAFRGSEFVLPPTLTFSIEEDLNESKRRLFYVGCTRAKRQLYVTYLNSDAKGKPMQPVTFVHELNITALQPDVINDDIIQLQKLLPTAAENEAQLIPESDVLDQFVANYILNATGLNRYLECPLAFYYEEILQLPSFSGDYGFFGKAIHEALELYLQQLHLPAPLRKEGVATLLLYFRTAMKDLESLFFATKYRALLAYGESVLTQYYEQRHHTWVHKQLLEKRFYNILVQNVPVTGVVDRIDIHQAEKAYHIIDYKTGTRDAKKISPPDEKQPYGGEFWRQMAFYKLMVEASPIAQHPVGSAIISWVEPKKGTGKVSDDLLQFEPGDLSFMRQLIADVYHKIKQKQFSIGCKKPNCVWCNMLISGELDPERNADTEALDD